MSNEIGETSSDIPIEESFIRIRSNSESTIPDRRTIKEKTIFHLQDVISKCRKKSQETQNLDIIMNIIKKSDENILINIVEHLLQTEIIQKIRQIESTQTETMKRIEKTHSEKIKQIEQIQNEVTKQVIEQSNKQVIFQMQFPNKWFVGRESEIVEIEAAHDDLQIVVITGEFGVGKTELAKKYSKSPKHQHSNVLWIQCDTNELLMSSFRDLGVTVGLDLDELTDLTIVRKIIEYFNHKKTLMIFDSCHSNNLIVKNLIFFSIDLQHIKVLITSPDQNWDPYKTLKLQRFTPEESIQYIQSSLENELQKMIEVPRNDCEKLSNLLGYSPRALTKSIDYIIQRNLLYGNNQKYDINEHLSQLSKKHICLHCEDRNSLEETDTKNTSDEVVVTSTDKKTKSTSDDVQSEDIVESDDIVESEDIVESKDIDESDDIVEPDDTVESDDDESDDVECDETKNDSNEFVFDETYYDEKTKSDSEEVNCDCEDTKKAFDEGHAKAHRRVKKRLAKRSRLKHFNPDQTICSWTKLIIFIEKVLNT